MYNDYKIDTSIRAEHNVDHISHDTQLVVPVKYNRTYAVELRNQ